MAIIDNTMPLMIAVRSLLRADATLNSLGITEIYDRATPELAAPYITIGATSDVDWSTADSDGQELRMDVSVWDVSASQLPDTLRHRQIMKRVRELLHFSSLSLTSPSRAVLLQITNTVGPMLDPDGATLHGVITLRALLDHT